MTFLEALNSGNKVKSQYWDKNMGHIDTTIFTDKMELGDFVINLIAQTSRPITWKEMLGEWYQVEEES